MKIIGIMIIVSVVSACAEDPTVECELYSGHGPEVVSGNIFTFVEHCLFSWHTIMN